MKDILATRGHLYAMPIRKRIVAILSASILSQGCVPFVGHYVRIEASGATYLKSTCSGSVGMPNITYYPFNGIFISINLYPVLLGLHVPSGATVQLEKDTIKITASTKDGIVDLAVRLKPAPHQAIGTNSPPEFRRLPDPFDSNATPLGPFVGESSNGYYRWYLFVSTDEQNPRLFVSAPGGILRGTIEIPPMIVNGRHYAAQTLTFSRASYAGVLPVNC